MCVDVSIYVDSTVVYLVYAVRDVYAVCVIDCSN